MNWYKQAQLDFGAELANIGNLESNLMNNPYIQQQGNPNNDLSLQELNQQVNIDNKTDPEIRQMDIELSNAEDQDGDGKNDIEQLIEELQIQAKFVMPNIKLAQSNQPWLSPQIWQRLGYAAQERYNTSINAFKANVFRYREVKGQLIEQKELYDNGQLTDKGVLRRLVDETIKWVESSKQYGLVAKRMKTVIDRVKQTINLFAAENSEQIIRQNDNILNRSYQTVLQLMND